MVFNRILLMSTLAFASLAQAASAGGAPSAVVLDGARAAALAAAVPVFREKQPEADLANFQIHVHPAEDGTVQVALELLIHRVDDDGVARVHVEKHVGVRARIGVEELDRVHGSAHRNACAALAKADWQWRQSPLIF